MQKCLWTLSVVLAAGSAFLLGESPVQAAPEAAAPSDEVKQIVTRLQRMMKEVTTLRYDAQTRVQMPDGKRVAVTNAKVVAERMEQPGSWKLLVDGTFDYEAADPKTAPKKDNPITIRAAYDGTVLVGLQEKRKVLRKTAPRDLDTVRLDMLQLDAAGPVAWDLLTEPAFGNIGSATKVEKEAPAKADDLDCDVLWVVPAAGKNPPVPFRLYVAKKDGLPRRFELFKPAAARVPSDKRGEPGIVQSYSNVRVSTDLSGGTFDVALPAGWKVAADKNMPQDTSKPQTTESPAPKAPEPSKTGETKPLTAKHPLLPSDSQLVGPGTTAAPFKLKDTEGKERSLEEFKGKVVVLHFWGSWYPNSIEAFPVLQRTLDRYSDKGVVVLGMNFEQNAKVDPLKFMKDKKATYPTLVDAESMAGLYKVGGWSTFYVIGKDGKVVWAANGLASPPGGTNKQEEKLQYLEENLGQAVEKALK